MKMKSIAGLGLVLVVAGCSSDTPPSDTTGGTGGSGGSTAAGGSGGGVSAGTGGGTAKGGTGGTTASGGSGGTGSPGTGGTPAAGTGGGSPGAGMGGGVVGGAAGTPGTGGTGTAGTGTGGTGTAGAGTGGTGTAGTGVGGGGTGNDGPVTVQTTQTHQKIEGFGINNTWAPKMSDAEATALFGNTGTGLGLTILRVGMNSSGSYMSDNISADISLAKQKGATTIIGSCWSPKASCKMGQNGGASSENGGGHVLSSCYSDWADSIVKFAKDNSLYAMSIANEPDFASCGSSEPCNGDYQTTLYTAEEMVAFVKVAGPKFKTAGVKLIAPEASEWIHTWSNTSASGSDPGGKNSSDPLKCGFPATMCAAGKGYDYGHALFADKDAWGFLDIMGVHQYDTQVAEPWPADVPDKKPVWQTEMSGVKWWKEQGPSSDISNGVAVAGWVHDALVRGDAAAWVWWWYKANNTDDNEGLILKSGTDTKRHYTFGNFTKFVRPGYTRVDVTGAVPADVLLSAYTGTDGTVVVVAINKGAADATVPITIAGTAPAMMTPTVTSAADNLVAKAAVAVTGGSFMAALPSKTVTTFVGK